MEATINLKRGHGVQASIQVADFIKQYTENGTQEWSKEIQIITHLLPYRSFTAGQKVNSKHMHCCTGESWLGVLSTLGTKRRSEILSSR